MSLPDEIHDLYTTMEDYYRDLTFYFVHDRGMRMTCSTFLLPKKSKQISPARNP